jgi:hypothetical protein
MLWLMSTRNDPGTGSSSLRSAVEEKVPGLDEKVWEYLLDSGAVDPVSWPALTPAQRRDEVDVAVEHVKRVWRLLSDYGQAGPVAPSRRTIPAADDTAVHRLPVGQPQREIERARATLFAVEAANGALGREVRQWRERNLGARLLDPGEVESWLLRRSDDESAPVLDAIIAADGDYDVALASSAGRLDPRSFEFVEVTYPLIGTGGISEVTVPRGGELYRLRVLAVELAATYGWSEAQATMWVLTGAVPERPAITWKIDYATAGGAHLMQSNEVDEVPSGGDTELLPTRVTIELDPIAASPDDAAAAYMAALRHLGRKNSRPPTADTARLARFVLERAGQPRAEQYRQWRRNRREPAYSDQQTFRLAANHAVKQIRRTVTVTAARGKRKASSKKQSSGRGER